MSSAPIAEFEAHRSLLMGIAYRMLSSYSDAEDIVQECYLRWRDADTDEIRSPRSWLTTVCSRLCLDRLKSARARREHYVGQWLPEPLIEGGSNAGGGDPAHSAKVDESVSMALLLTLEKLSPAERAAFLLHEVFGFTFEEVGGILEKSAAACRKLAERARTHVRAGKPRFQPDATVHEQLVDAFWDATHRGDLDKLKGLLAEEVTLKSDGGGLVPVAPKMLETPDIVGRFFVGVARKLTKGPHPVRVEKRWINGAPGILIFIDEELATVLCFEISESGQIAAIFAQRNPEKIAAAWSADTTVRQG